MKPVYLLWLAIAALMFMPLTLVAETGLGQSAFNITRSSSDGIQVHFDLPQWKLESVQRNGETLQRVTVADAQYIFIDEEETLPVFTTLIAIPYSGGVTLNTLGSDQQNRSQIKLDFDGTLANERNNNRYSAALYPENQALISAPQVLRDFRVVSVNIYPFQYDQQNKQLIVNESMDIRIDFNNSPSINEIAPPTSYSSAFAKIYQGLILNYNEMIDRDVTYTSPKMLVIYGNYADATYLAKVNEYVAWKRQKGFIISAVSTATSGTTDTAIKAYIQTQYNNTATRPDYIVLIGDTSGNIAIPTSGSYEDYIYTLLGGGDRLGDAVIGRISVETTEQMINYMAKIVSLEQNLDIGTASWLDKMVLVGDTASSGISTVYTNRYIHDHSLVVNPDYAYTELYGSGPSSATINTAINTGVAFYNYRGYMGMSGWPSSISSLNNSYRLFHAVFITCATGSFGGSTSTTESIVRQGTASTLGGSVTAIGMATTSTHTPMNNCLNVGIFHGIYPLGMRDMGSAMLYGKIYLYAVYGVSNLAQANSFSGFCNLIGDPTASVYVSIPSTFSVTAPGSIPAGSSNIEVTVKNSSGIFVEGASVTLTNPSGLQVLGFTGADGSVLLSFANTTAGTLTLTVNKDDYKPSVSSVAIVTSGGVVYSSISVDDDSDGQSIGNGNSVANSGETIELYVNLRNTTTVTQFLSADVIANDPYVTLVDFERIEYNSIIAGGTGVNITPIVFEIAANCPDQHQLTLTMSVESTSGYFTVFVPLTIRSGKLGLQSYTFVGATGNIIYPGNQFPMTISLSNSGLVDLSGVNARLRSSDMFFSVVDSLGYYGNIDQGSSASNISNTFTVYARGSGFEGMIVPLTLYLFTGDGFEQTIAFSVTVGQPGLNDPLGQDDYGYFIFDNGDTGYDQCPTYSWVGIAPAEGGSGTALTLTDPGSSSDEGDQPGAVAIQTVTLPFAFQYYGIDYTQASISSNGFIAFGATQDADWRNWRMPDAGGPSPMVAAFWDDLDIVSGTSYVYTYYNANLHYYVVEWYHMVSGYDSATQETFQTILYDPVFYPTHTGDGQIKIQYQSIANIDMGDGDQYPHGNYCTVGIENNTETDGLEYTFNNSYPAQAASLANGRALFITTRPMLPDYPYVAIDQVTILDANSNSQLEIGETANLAIVLGNRGLVTATNVAATLTSSDPYVTINSNYSSYGNIIPQGNAASQTNYAIAVSSSCPAEHSIVFDLAVTCATGSWNYNFSLSVVGPELGFSNQMVSDPSGNQNGILDPGETATIIIHLNNTGEVPSTPGTATLTSPTPGMTVTTGTDTFSSIAAGSYEVLTFNVSASALLPIGTSVQMNYSATAGMVTGNTTEYLVVGAPLAVIIGTGTAVTTGTQNSPVNISNKSTHGQSIYTAAELNASGVTGPLLITGLGFYVVTAPNLALPDFVVRLKHTTASTSAEWQTSADLLTTYSNPSYLPTAGGFDMLTFSTPFQWNGTDNILIDTAFGLVATDSDSGTLQYAAVTTGYRFAYSDTEDQTNVFTGGLVVTRRYNVRLAYQPLAVGALITVNPITLPFGNVTVNNSSTLQFTVQNTGDQILTGTITTPTGYSVAQAGTRESELQADNPDRNVLSISVAVGQTKTYNLTFAPTAAQAYNGNVVIATNAADTPTVNVVVTGYGEIPSLPAPVVSVTCSAGNNVLSWNAVPTALQYKIYSSAVPNGTYTLLGTTSNLTYTDTRILLYAFYYVVAVSN